MMNTSLVGTFGVVVSTVLQLTLLLSVALLVSRYALRWRPAARYTLWKSVLITLLMLPCVAVATSAYDFRLIEVPLLPDVDVAAESAGLREAPTFSTPPRAESPASNNVIANQESVVMQLDLPAVAATSSPVHAPTVVEPASPSAAEGMQSTLQRERWDDSGTWFATSVEVGTWVWCLGLCWLGLRFTLGVMLVVRLHRQAIPCTFDAIQTRALEDVRQALSIAELPPILESSRVSGPVTIGLLRAKVILPAGLAVRLNHEQLCHVLHHECLHAVRGDHLLTSAGRLVAILFWPHPLIHFFVRELNQAIEDLCDSHVSAFGQMTEYARSLLSVSLMCHDDSPNRTPLLGTRMFGKRQSLEQRISWLVDNRRSTSTRAKAWLMGVNVLMLVAAVGLMSGIGLAQQSEAKGENGPTSSSKTAPKESGTRAAGLKQLLAKAEWSDMLKGLRVRIATERTVYHSGDQIPLHIELQNASKQPIAFDQLSRQVRVRVTDLDDQWVGIARDNLEISPWEGRHGELSSGESIIWSMQLERLRFNKPVKPGTKLKLTVSVPAQIVEPGKLPRTSHSRPLVVLFESIPASTLTPNHFGDAWSPDINLVCREVGGLFAPSRVIHINGDGVATAVRPQQRNEPDKPLLPIGRTEVKLPRERLDGLVKLLAGFDKETFAMLKPGPPFPDEPQFLLSLSVGGATLENNFPDRIVRKNKQLQVLHGELRSLMTLIRDTHAARKAALIHLPKLSPEDGRDEALRVAGPLVRPKGETNKARQAILDALNEVNVRQRPESAALQKRIEAYERAAKLQIEVANLSKRGWLATTSDGKFMAYVAKLDGGKLELRLADATGKVLKRASVSSDLGRLQFSKSGVVAFDAAGKKELLLAY